MDKCPIELSCPNVTLNYMYVNTTGQLLQLLIRIQPDQKNKGNIIPNLIHINLHSLLLMHSRYPNQDLTPLTVVRTMYMYMYNSFITNHRLSAFSGQHLIDLLRLELSGLLHHAHTQGCKPIGFLCRLFW